MSPYRERAIQPDRCPELGCGHLLALHDPTDEEIRAHCESIGKTWRGRHKPRRCHVSGCKCGRSG